MIKPNRMLRQCGLIASIALFSISAGASNSSLAVQELGRQIFSDPQFSVDHATSCSSCHKPEHFFSSTDSVAVGHNQLHSTRNAPSLLNATVYKSFFWDGRAPTLEDQVLRPFLNGRELGLESYDQLLAILRQDPHYPAALQQAFGARADEISISQVASALSVYVRSLGSGVNRFDCFQSGSDPNAFSAQEREGLEIFKGDAHCASCHLIEGGRPSLTDNRFHVSGIGASRFSGRLSDLSRKLSSLDQASRENLLFSDPAIAASGRYIVSLDPKDIGAFRTPSLRNVVMTAPYMHDGSIATLGEAVDYELYYTGSQKGDPIIITPKQKQALLAFLGTLSDMYASPQECPAGRSSTQ